MKNEIRLAAHEICPGKLSGGRKSKPTTCLELTTFFASGILRPRGYSLPAERFHPQKQLICTASLSIISNGQPGGFG